MANSRVTIDPATFDPQGADPELTALNDAIVSDLKTKPGLWSMPEPKMRTLRRKGQGAFPMAPRDKAAETVTLIVGAGREIDVRVLRPSNGATRGTYLHLHGGGWVFGGADETDPRLRRFADATGLTVASVEYRLAPENKFPAAPEDCLAAAVALANGNLADLPRGYLAIGGESAGAHLAVLTLIGLRDEYGMMPYRAANLVAGCYDLSLTPSARAAEERLVLDSEDIKEFVLRFVPDDIHLKDPRVSPLYADLSGLPPAFFSVGSRDLLLDDTLFMATRWLAAGNDAELSVTNGGCHVFQAFPTAAGDRSLGEMEAFIERRMASPL